MKNSLKLAPLALAAFATASFAGNCLPRDQVVDKLTNTYGQTQQNKGLDVRGNIIETFSNANSGSWTIFATTPHGMACIITSGKYYEADTSSPAKTPKIPAGRVIEPTPFKQKTPQELHL